MAGSKREDVSEKHSGRVGRGGDHAQASGSVVHIFSV